MYERFIIIKHEKNPYILKSCPVVMHAHAITKDNELDKILAQCKLENISNKSILGLFIKVRCYGIDGKELASTDEFSYLDLNISQYANFGDQIAIPIQDKNTRKITVIPQKIVFSDESVWLNESMEEFALLGQNLISIDSLGELAAQYRRELKESAGVRKTELHKTMLCIGEVFTTCGCGQVLFNNGNVCPNCGANIAVLENLKGENVLRENLVKYNLEQNKIIEEKRKRDLEVAERQIEEEKILKASKTKKNRKILIGIVVAGLLFSTYYLTQIVLPQQRLAKETELENMRKEEAIELENIRIKKVAQLFEEEKYDELIELYKDTVNEVGVDEDIRSGVLKIAHKYALKDEYKDLIDAISLLADKDEKYKHSYELIIAEYEKENYEVVNQLVTQMDAGHLLSGQIEVNTTLVVGLDLKSGLMYSPFRKYKENVEVVQITEYENGKLNDESIYKFTGNEYGGTGSGWGTRQYLYIGEIANNTLEGKGSLYLYQSLMVQERSMDGKTSMDIYGEGYVKFYEGDFKDGRFDGKGTIFWNRPKGGLQAPKMIIPKDKIIETECPLIVASFKEGIIDGKYRRYYQDGDLNDTGESYDGKVNSSQYGFTDNSGMWSDIKIHDKIELEE